MHPHAMHVRLASLLAALHFIELLTDLADWHRTGVARCSRRDCSELSSPHVHSQTQQQPKCCWQTVQYSLGMVNPLMMNFNV